MKPLLIILTLFFSFTALSQTEEPIEITWEDLGYTSLDVVYVDSLDSYFNEPVFNSGVSELVGKQIKIKGYFQCIHQETEYYWLSKDKIASYGCIEGENPFMTIDISNCTGLETLCTGASNYMDKVEITVKGLFILNTKNIYKLNFILENAELVSD